MCTFSIRLTDAEKKIIEEYAKLNNKSMGDVVKTAFFEKIEDEFDIKIADEGYLEYKKNPKNYSLGELKEELDI